MQNPNNSGTKIGKQAAKPHLFFLIWSIKLYDIISIFLAIWDSAMVMAKLFAYQFNSSSYALIP